MEMRDMDCNEEANGTTREELVERVALMEEMIAEGRRTTARYGWTFVMWGLLYFAAIGWERYLPHPNFAWPVCMSAGFAASIGWRIGRRRAGSVEGSRSSTLAAVWTMMGVGVGLFTVFGAITHHANNVTYLAAILFFIGLAHATSAMILRWAVQGVVAAIWWGSGIAVYYVPSGAALGIFLTATFFGQIVFGLYAMVLERRMTQERRHG